MNTCKSCQHYRPKRNGGGECWRYPPSIPVPKQHLGQMVIDVCRPPVGADQTCGEWAPALAVLAPFKLQQPDTVNGSAEHSEDDPPKAA